MIPKKLHYCWFGRNTKPELAIKCLESWKKFCPDYEIIEWNEENYDIQAAPLYVRQAYEAEKWAFVTDYVRLDVIYKNGGIYLDTDVELIRRLDILLQYKAFFGFENQKYINTGLGFGAEQGCSLFKEIMRQYQDIPFVKEDGSIDITPCPERNTDIFISHGLVQNGEVQILAENIAIFPVDYFCPLECGTRKLKITPNTISIHHYDASWKSEEEKKRMAEYYEGLPRAMRKYKLLKIVKSIMGENLYQRIKGLTKWNK